MHRRGKFDIIVAYYDHCIKIPLHITMRGIHFMASNNAWVGISPWQRLLRLAVKSFGADRHYLILCKSSRYIACMQPMCPYQLLPRNIMS